MTSPGAARDADSVHFWLGCTAQGLNVRVQYGKANSPPQSNLGRVRRYPTSENALAHFVCCTMHTADECNHSAMGSLDENYIYAGLQFLL